MNELHPPLARQTRLLSIDVLRAVAALGVFLSHAAGAAGFDKFRLPVVLPFSETSYSIPNPFSLGASGVSLFFLVSGYCLTRSWFQSGASQVELSRYFTARFSRVYPAYLFSLIVTFVIWVLLEGSDAILQEYSVGRPGLLFDFAIHSLFLQGFSTASFLSYNGTLWSMATEVQFYVLLPAIFVCMARYGHWPLMVLAFVGCMFVRYFAESIGPLAAPVEGGVAYSVLISYSLVGRLFEFVVGMAVAASQSRGGLPRIRIPVVVLLLIASALLRWKGPGWAVDPVWGISFGGLLLWMLRVVDKIGLH